MNRASKELPFRWIRRALLLAAYCAVGLLPAQFASAATQYWDTNGSAAGSGNAGGTWAGGNWSSAVAGDVATSTWTSNNDAVFSAGTDGVGNLAIDLGATSQNVRNISVEEGNISIGGTSGNLTLPGNSVYSAASGTSLAISRNISKGNFLLTVNGAGTTTISGAITGGGPLYVETTGGLFLSGTGNTTSDFRIGNTNPGSVTITGGTLTVTNTAYMAQNAGVAASYSQTGGTATFNSGLHLANGGNAPSTVSVSAGTFNAVANATDQLMLGQRGNGTLTVSGSGAVNVSVLAMGGWIGTANTVIANLDGGTLTVRRVSEQNGTPGTFAASNAISTFNFNGGTLKAAENQTDFMTLVDNVNVKSGGAIIDTNGFNITIAKAFSNLGGGNDLTKQGVGTLTLSNANAFAAIGAMDVTVKEGTLNLSALTTISLSSLKGDGVLDVTGKTATLTAGGVLMPGNSPGVLDVTGNLNIAAIADTGGLTFELGDSLVPADNDRVNITGLLTLGTLNFADFTFVPGGGFDTGSYTLFSAGSYAGSIGIGPAANGMIGAFSGTLSMIGNDVILDVVLVPEPATFAMLMFGGVMLWHFGRKPRARA